jgi:hypothetical protein
MYIILLRFNYFVVKEKKNLIIWFLNKEKKNPTIWNWSRVCANETLFMQRTNESI